MSLSPMRYCLELELTPRRDIQVLKTYGAAPYGAAIKKLEQQIKEKQQSVDEKIGVKVHNPRGYYHESVGHSLR